MSFFPCLMPINASVILEDARRELGLLEKEFGFALGYDTAAEWSKAKHRKRSCDIHQIMESAPEDVQRVIASRWLAALQQKPERDLVADLVAKVDRLLAVVGRQAKAELRDDERREVA